MTWQTLSVIEDMNSPISLRRTARDEHVAWSEVFQILTSIASQQAESNEYRADQMKAARGDSTSGRDGLMGSLVCFPRE
ncbi:MAG: hypothetical protein DWH84_01525 [Planctomycetota bacterium]|nr:MAG: hypothetical protein DWH84_01525 [Planctomycetota bacterium]